MENNIEKMISVDQIGYPTVGKKRAFFYKVGEFRVVDHTTGEVVFQSQTKASIDDFKSGKNVYVGDFSSLEKPGHYIIEQTDGLTSFPFEISDSPYSEVQRGLLKAFYFFRCGMALEEKYAGPWKHDACHTAKGKVYGEPERLLDSSGGWHDAGDYGKYTAPGAKAVADLLLAYAFYPEAFREALPLPETDGHTPDVLHECRYELDWLFKMQDSESGGVFHKLTKLHFAGLDVMPEDDLEDLYFSPISGTATGTFSAVMAMAARIYQPFDADFSKKCLEAAVKAWEWLQANPDVPGFKNPPEISTGEYGDPVDTDERFWAAAELYRTTGENQYLQSFEGLIGRLKSLESLGWTDVSGYGTLSFLFNDKVDAESSFYVRLKDAWISKAEGLLKESQVDGYGISLIESDYIWGSNMVVMNNAMTLLVAYRLTGHTDFEACALDHVHYLLGRNALNISYVTGFGSHAMSHPHYRPSIADDVEAPVPGLVSGGPNRGLQDDVAKKYLVGKPAAQAFIDHIDSYSTNEVAIYWNSPALFAVSHFVK